MIRSCKTCHSARTIPDANAVDADPPIGRALAALAASAVLAWRAASRYMPCRILSAILVLLSVALPFLTRSFFYFGEESIQAEVLVSNLFLWTTIFSFLLLPPLAHGLESRSDPAFSRLVPVRPLVLVWGRFLGFWAAYGVVALVLGTAGLLAAFPVPAGMMQYVWIQGLVQVMLGAVLISGMMLFSRLGHVVATSLAGAVWFLLGTQKPVLLHTLLPGDSVNYPLSVALAWIPDFTLYQPPPAHASAPFPVCSGLLVGIPLAYTALLVALFLGLAALLSGKGTPRRAG